VAFGELLGILLIIIFIDMMGGKPGKRERDTEQ
jgi:hypothetical protein